MAGIAINHNFLLKVVTDSRKSRQGAYIECVGTYNPVADKDKNKVQIYNPIYLPPFLPRYLPTY